MNERKALESSDHIRRLVIVPVKWWERTRRPTGGLSAEIEGRFIVVVVAIMTLVQVETSLMENNGDLRKGSVTRRDFGAGGVEQRDYCTPKHRSLDPTLTLVSVLKQCTVMVITYAMKRSVIQNNF